MNNQESISRYDNFVRDISSNTTNTSSNKDRYVNLNAQHTNSNSSLNLKSASQIQNPFIRKPTLNPFAMDLQNGSEVHINNTKTSNFYQSPNNTTTIITNKPTTITSLNHTKELGTSQQYRHNQESQPPHTSTSLAQNIRSNIESYQNELANTSTSSIPISITNSNISSNSTSNPNTSNNSVLTSNTDNHVKKSHPYNQEVIPSSGNNNKQTVYPTTPIDDTKRNLSEFSKDALEFYNIYQEIVDDSTDFTPTLQLKWVETLLIFSFNENFIKNYNINAEKLKKYLSNELVIKNQKILIDHAFKVLTKLISINYPDALYLAGTLYSNKSYLKSADNKYIDIRRIVRKDDTKALKFYEKAANLNHSESYYRLGICYEYQVGIEKDNTDSSDTQFSEHLKKSYKYYEIGAIKFLNHKCMYKLGMINLNGFESNPEIKFNINIETGLNWLKKSAKLGKFGQAYYQLGKIYEFNNLNSNLKKNLMEFSDITIQNKSKAIHYYYKAAIECNYSLSQWKIGNLYENGDLGLPISTLKSIFWYMRCINNDEFLSSKNGNNINKKSDIEDNLQNISQAMAMLSISGWYLTGSPNVLLMNLKESFNWVKKSCEISSNKLSKNEYILGYYYENGIGCDKDIQQSKIHYQNSYNLGYLKALDRFNKSSFI
ncbi:hypothetical protein TBLA_0H00490 [Henningerozyma blattae CBS 6284]|uniref:Activator of C kinase protein 1 n=1 Tax=Henningerozyma blattae (strain ATCC 34711 / CBS 6284 / DSM 70876 / NBRC 10599 / NRRL Y-10934 / UCD 77-7) TaxID=1071380 RepID=I2H7I9_HENB6|nr:hypothetical protein TBLA_0H00490 [Tetrapisispora blattae CBS 6284]CCH62341.1 hypothetical protein TBLA_0H00490 [Tetrapisispora blattae CBS 6284]